MERKIQSSRQLNFSDQTFPSERVNKDKDTEYESSESLTTVGVNDGLTNAATKTKELDDNKNSQELSHVIHCSPQHPNPEECSKFQCLPVEKDDPMTNVETEDFEMSSDDDLFGDPQVLESLCKSSDAVYHATKDQKNDDSQEGASVYHKPRQDLSQSVNSVVLEKSETSEHCDTDENLTQCPQPLEAKKDNVKEEMQAKQSTTGQKQQSLLSFVTKGNKATKNKTSLKQTDIGVFFGLKPLKKPVNNKVASQDDTKMETSSQAPSVSQQQGGWGRRRTFNHEFKNTGFISKGESSGDGEDATAGTSGTQSHRRSCPFYKKIPNCGITVDAFRYGNIPGCRAYFLSHFHYDHYGGLNGKFTNSLYCSKVIQTQCVTYSTNYFQWLTLESWF